MLPNLIGIGAQRAATTWMYRCLSQHPDIFLSSAKELHFFSANYDEGLEWYQEHFKEAKGQKVVGEISPNYMYYETAIKRIKEQLPDTKLVVILRNPVDRAVSAYQLHNEKYEGLSFRQAYESDKGLIDRGMYGKHLNMVLKYFDLSQLKIVFYDDVQEDPEQFLKSILLFLGVDSSFEFEGINKRYNRIMYPKLQKYISMLKFDWIVDIVKRTAFGDWIRNRHVDSNMKSKLNIGGKDLKELKAIYTSDIQLIEKMTNRKLDAWL